MCHLQESCWIPCHSVDADLDWYSLIMVEASIRSSDRVRPKQQCLMSMLEYLMAFLFIKSLQLTSFSTQVTELLGGGWGGAAAG